MDGSTKLTPTKSAMSSDPICFRYFRQPGALPGHEDLELRVGNRCFIADTYYFLIQSGPRAPSSRLGSRIARLLDQWLQLLDKLTPQRPVYLPWNFSDQCTAWLRVALVSDDTWNVHLEPGWSDIEGFALDPNDVFDTEASICRLIPMDEGMDYSVETELGTLRSAISRDRDVFADLVVSEMDCM